jgi:hypothetical protein
MFGIILNPGQAPQMIMADGEEETQIKDIYSDPQFDYAEIALYTMDKFGISPKQLASDTLPRLMVVRPEDRNPIFMRNFRAFWADAFKHGVVKQAEPFMWVTEHCQRCLTMKLMEAVGEDILIVNVSCCTECTACSTCPHLPSCSSYIGMRK